MILRLINTSMHCTNVLPIVIPKQICTAPPNMTQTAPMLAAQVAHPSVGIQCYTATAPPWHGETHTCMHACTRARTHTHTCIRTAVPPATPHPTHMCATAVRRSCSSSDALGWLGSSSMVQTWMSWPMGWPSLSRRMCMLRPVGRPPWQMVEPTVVPSSACGHDTSMQDLMLSLII